MYTWIESDKYWLTYYNDAWEKAKNKSKDT